MSYTQDQMRSLWIGDSLWNAAVRIYLTDTLDTNVNLTKKYHMLVSNYYMNRIAKEVGLTALEGSINESKARADALEYCVGEHAQKFGADSAIKHIVDLLLDHVNLKQLNQIASERKGRKSALFQRFWIKQPL